MLYHGVSKQMAKGRDSESPGSTSSSGSGGSREESPSLSAAAKGAIQQTCSLLSSTTSTTRTVLHRVSEPRWWKNTLGSLHPLRSSTSDSGSLDKNDNFNRQGCHPFYDAIVSDCFSNKVTYILKFHLTSRPS